MKGFPKEINTEVLKNLPGKEILKLCNTSKSFKMICSDDPKYNSLWKLKIEQDFQEIYTGSSAFSQYRYLNKLFNQYLYLLYYSNDDEEEELLGIYDMHAKAVMAGINYIQERLEENGEFASLESIKYIFWKNWDGDNFRYNNYHNLRIEKTQINKLDKIVDERKFFQDRENLYITLFGKSSEGFSSQMPDPDPYQKIKNYNEENYDEENESFPESFFLILDLSINNLNNQKQDENTVMENFNELNLNSRQLEIIKNYIIENIYLPEVAE